PEFEFDRSALAVLERGDLSSLLSLSTEKLDEVGNTELLTWYVLFGAIGDQRADVLSYQPTWHHGLGVVNFPLPEPLAGPPPRPGARPAAGARAARGAGGRGGRVRVLPLPRAGGVQPEPPAVHAAHAPRRARALRARHGHYDRRVRAGCECRDGAQNPGAAHR